MSKVIYSGDTLKQFLKHKIQLRDSIIQCSVYKYSLLINKKVNVLTQHRIDRNEFVVSYNEK